MSNKYIRHQPMVSREADSHIDEDHWLQQFAKNLEKGAVQTRTNDQSIFEQINTIMNGKAKYPSVAAAVQDMQERSGLTAYLEKEKLNKLSENDGSNKKIATHMPAPQHEITHEKGFKAGEKDKGKRLKTPILSIIKEHKIDPRKWIQFVVGYGRGADLSPDERRVMLAQVAKQMRLERLSQQDQNKADDNRVFDKKVKLTPIVINKSPQILRTLENIIQDSKGNLSIPAIIERIKSIHRQDVSEAKDWEDDNLLRLVSRLNLEAKSNNPENFQQQQNLGLRDDDNASDIDPSNTDAFHGLNPVKF